MSGWEALPLSEVLVDAKPGFACGDDPQDGVFQFRMNNVTTEGQLDFSKKRRVPRETRNLESYLVQPGDVLFNATNSPELVGKSAFFPGNGEPSVFSNHFLRLRPKAERLDGRFLAQWLILQFQRRVFNGMCRQWVNQATVGRDSLLALRIPLPPLAEQRRIAMVLDRAEALRAKRRAALAQLDTLSQAIFLDLFGDPGSNPKGWPMCPVSDYVAEFQGGKSIEAESGENAVTLNRVLKISAVTGMKFLSHESKPVPDSYQPSPEHFTKPGDLLFSRANTTELVGAVAYVETTPSNLLLPDKLWRFVWRLPSMVEPLFVWALFQTQTVRREIARRATGTSGSMKNISQAKLFGIRTILPPISIQRDFTRRIDAVEKLKTVHRASLAELDALFAVLQHRAFRGEL
jgi:type I restriction enzyme, S subunit